jgi:hypothetical protein
VSQLHERDQKYMRQLIANNIRKLINEQKTLKERRQTAQLKLEYQERNLINKIKKKINQNKVIAAKADIGNTLVVLNKEDYNNKIEEL